MSDGGKKAIGRHKHNHLALGRSASDNSVLGKMPRNFSRRSSSQSAQSNVRHVLCERLTLDLANGMFSNFESTGL